MLTEVEDGMCRVEVFLGPVEVRCAVHKAVRAVDVFLLGWQREDGASAGVAHGDGLAARRWRRRGDRRRLELNLEEGRVCRVGGGELQKGIG